MKRRFARFQNTFPSLIALGEYKYRRGWFEEAKALLEKAVRNEHLYNLQLSGRRSGVPLGIGL